MKPFDTNDARKRLKQIRSGIETAAETVKMLSANGKLSPSLTRAQLSTTLDVLNTEIGSIRLLIADSQQANHDD